MSHYMIQVAYTSESWKTQVQTQADVIDRISPLVTQCRGSIECIYYAFGDTDLVGIIDFPHPEDAAAFSLAASAGGAIKTLSTTPLLTVAQGKTAMKKANAASKAYTPALPVSLVEQRAKAKTSK